MFISAALILMIAPGPATTYIIARSIERGRLVGVISALGMATGTLVYVIAAALGISAILVSSPLAFTIVKFSGALYLIYLGMRKFSITESLAIQVENEHASLQRIFNQAVLVNLLNPKTAIFFFAFLPQFVEAGWAPVSLQILFLGIILVVIGIVTDSTYALLAGSIRSRLKENAFFSKVLSYMSGAVLIALGIIAAISNTGIA